MVNIIININNLEKINNNLGDLFYCFKEKDKKVIDIINENIESNKKNKNKLNIWVNDDIKIEEIFYLKDIQDESNNIYYIEDFKEEINEIYKLKGNIYIILLKDINNNIKNIALNNINKTNDPILNKIKPKKHFLFKNGELINNINERIIVKCYYNKHIKKIENNDLGSIESKIELLENHLRGFYYDSNFYKKYGA